MEIINSQLSKKVRHLIDYIWRARGKEEREKKASRKN